MRVCIYGKQRQPFPNSTNMSTKPEEIIYYDFGGLWPMEVESIGRSVYFLLLRNDYSHYRYVYFLKQKNEVIQKLMEFIPRIKTKTNEKMISLMVQISESTERPKGK